MLGYPGKAFEWTPVNSRGLCRKGRYLPEKRVIVSQAKRVGEIERKKREVYTVERQWLSFTCLKRPLKAKSGKRETPNDFNDGTKLYCEVESESYERLLTLFCETFVSSK